MIRHLNNIYIVFTLISFFQQRRNLSAVWIFVLGIIVSCTCYSQDASSSLKKDMSLLDETKSSQDRINSRKAHDLRWEAEKWFRDPKIIKLCHAIERQDVDEMQRLIDSGADVNARGQGILPLLLWAFPVDQKGTECLLKNGANPNFVVPWTDCVNDVLLTQGGSLLNVAASSDGRGKTKHRGAVEMLLKYGADPNFGEIKPLGTACLFENSDETIIHLVEAGADLHATRASGDPIPYVCYCLDRCRFGLTLYLLEHGADYDIHTRQGAQIQRYLYEKTVAKPDSLKYVDPEELQKLPELIKWLTEHGVTFDKPAPMPTRKSKKNKPEPPLHFELASVQTQQGRKLNQRTFAPEFISGDDAPTNVVRNEDRYTKFIDAKMRCLTTRELLEGDKIYAAVSEHEACFYVFCDADGKAPLNMIVEDPLLKINMQEGNIKVFRAMTPEEIASPPSFTIVAYAPFETDRYDVATLDLKPLIVDLHIDDGNPSPEPDGQPALSRDDQFLLKPSTSGAAIKPNWGAQDGVLDCWKGYSTDKNVKADAYGGKFYPVVVQIPDGIPLSDIKIKFDYPMASLEPIGKKGPFAKGSTSELSDWRLFGDGAVRLWKKDGASPRDARSLLSGGDLIEPENIVGKDVYYSPEQLGFSDSNRKVVLYLEGVSESLAKTRKLAEKYGLPRTTLKLTVETLGQTFEAEVPYVVSNEISSYSELLPKTLP